MQKTIPSPSSGTVFFSSSKTFKRLFFLFALIAAFGAALYGQVDFPAGDFWALAVGPGFSGVKAQGTSIQGVLDARLWLSPPLVVGSRVDLNYSFEEATNPTGAALSNILTFEGQVYLRWNFLRLGKDFTKQINVFAQGGIGLMSAYRGDNNPLDNVTETRGSLLFDVTAGVTIPLTERWHLEPFAHAGYPHIWGFGLTIGYKFPLPKKTEYQTEYQTEYIQSEPQIIYRDVIRTLPANEIIRRLVISSVEFVLFGPDISKYNLGVDHDAQDLNELVLNQTAMFLKDNPDCQLRIEGHANPVTTDPKEADELMSLSTLRANTIAEQLRLRGVPETQMVIVAFGGTRTVTSERNKWDMNRRVELIIMQVDTN